MDSRLDSLFRTTFQPARETDTWQGIRREEPQDGQKKKDHERQHAEPGTEEDITTLSVVALHEFLKNLLQQSGEKFFGTAGETLSSREPEDGPPAPVNPASASAARAYQTTARHVPGRQIDFSEHGPTQSAVAPVGPAITLSADDLRTIHKLVEDVEDLGRRGISSIALHPAESFLQSLVIGVKEAAG